MTDARIIHLAGVDYEVRPMTGVIGGYEVWRGPVELGFFTVTAERRIEISSLEPYQVDEVVMRLVAEEYVRPWRA